MFDFLKKIVLGIGQIFYHKPTPETLDNMGKFMQRHQGVTVLLYCSPSYCFEAEYLTETKTHLFSQAGLSTNSGSLPVSAL